MPAQAYELDENVEKYSRLNFEGNTSEYFRIWIVNLFLTLATLGIYSAWATVRTRKYFYRNTVLDGHHFDYHASPIAILKGRLVALFLIALYVGSAYFSLAVQVLVLLLIILALPWAIVRSQIFSRRNTSYRNVCFDFEPRFKEAYRVMGVYALLTILSLGVAYPLFSYKLRHFIVNHTSFGETGFRFSGSPARFFTIYFFALAGIVLTVISAMFLTPIFALIFMLFGQMGEIAEQDKVPISVVVSVAIPVAIGIVAVSAYVRSRLTNYVLSETSIGANTFLSELRARDLTWIYLSNAFAIILSIGFLIPWADIRLARYRVECTSLVIQEPLDSFAAHSVEAESATGDELASFLDVGVGI